MRDGSPEAHLQMLASSTWCDAETLVTMKWNNWPRASDCGCSECSAHNPPKKHRMQPTQQHDVTFTKTTKHEARSTTTACNTTHAENKATGAALTAAATSVADRLMAIPVTPGTSAASRGLPMRTSIKRTPWSCPLHHTWMAASAWEIKCEARARQLSQQQSCHTTPTILHPSGHTHEQGKRIHGVPHYPCVGRPEEKRDADSA